MLQKQQRFQDIARCNRILDKQLAAYVCSVIQTVSAIRPITVIGITGTEGQFNSSYMYVLPLSRQAPC